MPRAHVNGVLNRHPGKDLMSAVAHHAVGRADDAFDPVRDVRERILNRTATSFPVPVIGLGVGESMSRAKPMKWLAANITDLPDGSQVSPLDKILGLQEKRENLVNVSDGYFPPDLSLCFHQVGRTRHRLRQRLFDEHVASGAQRHAGLVNVDVRWGADYRRVKFPGRKGVFPIGGRIDSITLADRAYDRSVCIAGRDLSSVGSLETPDMSFPDAAAANDEGGVIWHCV